MGNPYLDDDSSGSNPYTEKKSKKHKKKGLLSHIPSPVKTGLGVTLNVLDKPGQAIRSGIATIGEDSYKGKSPLHAIAHGVEKAGEGLIGKEHTSATEAASAAVTGRRDKIKKLPLGVDAALSIATDPTSYVSFGASGAAKAGIETAEHTLGKEVAKDIVKSGAKKALSADAKATLRKAIIDEATEAGLTAKKAAKAADRKLTALNRSGRGGLKIVGHSVPGLTAESAVGEAVTKINPKRAIGAALDSSKTGRAAKGIFVRGVDARHAPELGNAVTEKVLDEVRLAGDHAELSKAVTDTAGKNISKGVKKADLKDALRILEHTEAQPSLTDQAFSELHELSKTPAEATATAVKPSTRTYAEREAIKAETSGREGLARAIRFVDSQRRRITDEQIAAGRLAPEAAHDVDSWVPRQTTKVGRKLFEDMNGRRRAAEALSGNGYRHTATDLEKALTQGETAARKIRPDLQTEQLNQIFVDRGLVKPGEKVFSENPIANIVGRAHTADTAVAHSRMLENITKITDHDGNPVLQRIDEGAEIPEGMEDLGGGVVDETGRRYAGHPAVVKLLKEAKAVQDNDESMKLLREVSRKVGRVFRSTATAGPAFHARNEAGNVWLNFLEGVKSPKWYERAAKYQKAIGTAFKDLGADANLDAAIAASKLSDGEKKQVMAALKEGVITRGFFQEDLVHGAPHLAGEKRNIVSRAIGGANSGNRAIGSAIENNARMAHFLAKLEEYGSVRQASRSVKKTLFDYADLTPTERDFFKTVIPFYTFMRKNAPLEIEKAIAQPGKFTGLLHVEQDLQAHGHNQLPDVPVNALEDVLRPITGTSTPGSKTTSGQQRRFQALVSPLSPLPKALIEQGGGSSAYSGFPFTGRTGFDLPDLPGRLPNLPAVADRNEALISSFYPLLTKFTGAKRKSLLRSLLGFNETGAPKSASKGPAGSASASNNPYLQ